MPTITAITTIDLYRDQVARFLADIQRTAEADGWSGRQSTMEVTESPVGLGAPIVYSAPVLALSRTARKADAVERVVFEPHHRFTIGSAGRIDVTSFPAMREAMLLRRLHHPDLTSMTADELEELIAEEPWKAYSQELLPLSVDLADPDSLLAFLDDLVAPAW
jgi:hypothetical protein